MRSVKQEVKRKSPLPRSENKLDLQTIVYYHALVDTSRPNDAASKARAVIANDGNATAEVPTESESGIHG